MIYRWFGNKQIDDFAKSLVQDFATRFPPSTIEELLKEQPELFAPGGAKKSAAAVSKQYDKLMALTARCYQKTKDFKREYRLGVFKTATLSKAFQDELLRRGYPDVFAKEMTLGMAKALI